jgi:hypothetical protein
MFTVAGQNKHDEIDPNPSLSYDWSITARWIMPELRPGTRERRRLSRRGLAGILVAVVRQTL